MIQLTRKEVRHVATLARIGVSDEDVSNYQKDLSNVLSLFEELNEVDTKNIKPIGHITGMTNVFRADRVESTDKDTKEQIMESIPSEHDGYIKVKSVL